MTDKELSQYDLGLVLRDAHELDNHALRITSANTSVPAQYSRVSLTYNSSDSVTEALFYGGQYAEIRHVRTEADVAGSLNNTYFTLYSENDESRYHVWYNVDGTGVDPAPANSRPVVVHISSNDSANVVAYATKLFLEVIEDFKVESIGPDLLKITNDRMGISTDISDSGTGFTLTTVQQGSETLIKQVKVPFDGKTKYYYNTQERRFEVAAAVQEVSLSGSFSELDIKNPNTMVIINTNIASLNVETNIALPTETKRYRIKARNNAKLKLAFVATQTATNYYTITKGSIFDSKDIDIPNSTTIYVLSDTNDTDVELIVWRRT